MTFPSAIFAREMLAAFATHGVRDVVLSPGSRSGPLAHAVAQAALDTRPAGAPTLNLHVRIDERDAAFLALGIARGRWASGERSPVLVITTSGTAVGNLMPAVMEAHHSGLSLILLTADRPGELRGVGANQTTDQMGIFGGFVRHAADVSAAVEGEQPGRAARVVARAVAAAMGDRDRDDFAASAGPVHLNVEFRDPLGRGTGPWPSVPHPGPTRLEKARMRMRAVGTPNRPLPRKEKGIVIAGDAAGDLARQVAEAHGWPLLAEPSSGARAGENAIGPYVVLLSTEEGQRLAAQVEQVVVIGRPTLSRPITRLINESTSLYVAKHGARWREAPRHAERVLPRVPEEWLTRAGGTLPPGRAAGPWLSAWLDAVEDVPLEADAWNSFGVAREVIATLGDGDLAVIGSSGAIRAVDRVAPVWAPGERPILLANRGLAGIDGTISTAAGVALGSGRPVTALMGDVTFLHDVGGLLVGPREQVPDLRIVVLNDGGGQIFSMLEHAAGEPEVVERVFTTPHDARIGAICEGYRVAHTEVASLEELRAALAGPIEGLSVIEAKLRG